MLAQISPAGCSPRSHYPNRRHSNHGHSVFTSSEGPTEDTAKATPKTQTTVGTYRLHQGRLEES